MSRTSKIDLEFNQQLLPGVEFRVSKDEWDSAHVTIACYYSRRQNTLQQVTSWRSTGGRNIGWRNFCHETRIAIPTADWPNHERLHQLKLSLRGPTCTSPVVAPYKPADHDAQKLIFYTSAECKAFVLHNSSSGCDSRHCRGRGPEVSLVVPWHEHKLNSLQAM